MNFYALFSKSQGCYNTPFLAHDDKEAVAIISKTVVSHQDPALMMSLDDLELKRVGRFEPDNDRPLQYLDYCPSVLEDLHLNLPLPPMIKNQVDKLYVREEAEYGAQ